MPAFAQRLVVALADTFNYEYQSRSSAESAEVLASLAHRMAGCIEDPRERKAFLDVASMSGLDIARESARMDPRGLGDGLGR